MQTFGAFEAKTHFYALLEQVEKGEQIMITKHGYPVAKLVSAKTPSKEIAKQAVSEIKRFNRSHTLEALDWKVLRDEGRK